MRFSVLVLACVVATAVAVGTANEEQYQVLTPEDIAFKPIHELSVAEGMDLISESALKPTRHERRLLIEGVQQPDLQAAFPTKIEIMMQGVGERLSQPKKHDFMALRVATQHIHAVSFALKMFNKNTDKVVSVPGYPIPKDNGFETLSFVNNRQVHNKMLETLAGWFWIALADRNATQAGWKMGNVLHSLGDSYAGGHTHRSKPTESHASASQNAQQPHSRFGDVDCSTSEVIMFNSMDVANWNNHLEPDLQTKDWRFNCLKQHISQLVQFWKAGRKEVQRHAREDKRIETVNTVMKKVGEYLCTKALRFNKSRLEWPAGGQVAGFSSLSELKLTDNSKAKWAHVNIAKLKKKLGGAGDQPIMPIGLTTPELSEQFIKEVAQAVAYQDEDNKKLKTVILHGFTYPTRSEPSYCDDPEYKAFQIGGPVYTAINQGVAPKDHWVDWKGMGFRPDIVASKNHPLLDQVSGDVIDSWTDVAKQSMKKAAIAAAHVYHTYLWKAKSNPGSPAVEAMIDGKAPYDF